jgi:erythromycin esterase-like protein
MVEFVEWLRQHNDLTRVEDDRKVNIVGLDVYSLETSRDAVLKFLDKYDPEFPGLMEMAEMAYSGSRRRYVNSKGAEKVLRELEKLEERFPHFEELFVAAHNARCVKGANDYYQCQGNSWNHRDTFMFNTLNRVMERCGDGKAIIWAHNSHLGDSRYTRMHREGEINLGRLVKEHFGLAASMNIGFTTYDGSVTASYNWDEEPSNKRVNPGMIGSIENLLHQAILSGRFQRDNNTFALILRSTASTRDLADKELIDDLCERSYEERAIGVIYRPKTERISHYFDVKVARQFDVVIHVDRSKALRPLDLNKDWSQGERDNRSLFETKYD